MQNKTHYIDGQWLSGSADTALIESHNPATGALLWSGNAADADIVNAAVSSARKAFTDWSRMAVAERIEILRRYQEILRERQEQLATTISAETGKQLWEARTEAATMIGKVDLSIQAYDERTGTREKDLNGSQATLTHRPHGVLAVLGPYNFPGHLPNGHIVPALIAGNTIVFKPSEITPLVAQSMLECFIDAGLPGGVVNLVQGDGNSGALLGAHDDLNGLLFTGSSRTGAAIHKQFGGQPDKILALEMGGNNPLIVYRADDLNAAVYNTIQSAYITSGQRCTCARRLIVVRDAAGEEFVQALQKAIANITVAMPEDNPQAFFGPVVSNQVADMLMQAQQVMLDQGAAALLPMTRPNSEEPLLTPGLLDVTAMSAREDEELFGPLLQLIWVDSLEQAITEANETRYGLAAGMLTDDDDAWAEFYQRAHAGILNRNKPTTGASGGAPFGGVGASGNHRPSAFYAADYCAYPMASVCDERLAVPETLTPGVTV